MHGRIRGKQCSLTGTELHPRSDSPPKAGFCSDLGKKGLSSLPRGQQGPEKFIRNSAFSPPLLCSQHLWLMTSSPSLRSIESAATPTSARPRRRCETRVCMSEMRTSLSSPTFGLGTGPQLASRSTMSTKSPAMWSFPSNPSPVR